MGSGFGKVLIAVFLVVATPALAAQELVVAVAANFAPTLRSLVPEFEAQTGIELTLVAGSTGKHYAQIRNGAPFDVFFAADAERPAKLEADGAAKNRFTYACGRLVLWSSDPTRVDGQGEVLTRGRFDKIAIANPRLAPYGQAAQATLEALQLWQPLQDKLVKGENIGQVYQFIYTGAAELGFVALSQLHGSAGSPGSHWLVPGNLYPPIQQQAVVLRPSEAANALVAFMASESVQAVLRESGYPQCPGGRPAE